MKTPISKRLHDIHYSLSVLGDCLKAKTDFLGADSDEQCMSWETDNILKRLYDLKETLQQMIAVVDNGIAYFKARYDLFKEVK